MLASLVLALTPAAMPTELFDYVRKPDASFTFKKGASREPDLEEITLTSQTWQGAPWHHSIVVANPARTERPDTMVLIITGDRVDRADLPFARSIARDSGLATATLFDIPNQPLYDLREDALIMLTFGKYMETGDATWPLLFPMTKSVVRAMDTLQRTHPSLKHFVLTGASKRGWTTWLSGALDDPRVAGLAPAVFDFLNFPAQLRHQQESWGKLSEMLEDYDPAAGQTPEGQKLVAMVDPYSYLSRIKVPVLGIMGANDRYWTVDAHTLYWDQVRSHKFLRIVPNMGHDAGGCAEGAKSIAYFARGIAKTLAPVAQKAFDRGELARGKTQDWVASAPTLDFHDAKWTHAPVAGQNTATFSEITLVSGSLEASFTSPVSVRKK